MADYWKSQPKKMCEFCKCWIADNKPSVTFHENGKRHKENVAKRLSEIGKKSAKDAKNKLQVDAELQKMEEAALKAYMKDMEGNADFTSKLLLKELEEKRKKKEDDAAKVAEAKRAAEMAKQNEQIDNANKRKRALEKAATIKWYEANSDEGYTYYWHVDTNESKWQPPEVGYISIAEQRLMEEAGKKPVEKRGPKKKFKGKKLSSVKKRSSEDPVVPEKKKKSEETPAPTLVGPAPKPEPYGVWKSVETKPVEMIDLQLPAQKSVVVKAPTSINDRPKIKFLEKKITVSLADDINGPNTSFSGFKKKVNRGNARQRLDTDD